MENFKEIFNNNITDKLGVDESEIFPSAKFTEDLGANSLDMIELVLEPEKEFKITIPDEVAEEIKTVEDAE